jgi:hypothetical protein
LRVSPPYEAIARRAYVGAEIPGFGPLVPDADTGIPFLDQL